MSKTRTRPAGMPSLPYIYGGHAYGQEAVLLQDNAMDPGYFRPYLKKNRHGKVRPFVTVFNGMEDDGITPRYIEQPHFAINAPATVMWDAWRVIDQAVIEAAMPRMSFVNRIRGAGLTFNVPNAMGKTSLESGVIGRITPATISMDPARKGDADQPEADIVSLPLPIIHKDTHYTARQLAVSRSGNMPFDTTWARLASEEVAIEAERLFLGTSSHNGYKYGGGYVWGLMNNPDRMTKTNMTAPTAPGWTPDKTKDEVIDMREALRAVNQYGPFTLIVSPAWEKYLDKDYSAAYPGLTLRQAILQIEGIQGIESADYIDDGAFHMILLQLNTRTVRAVVGFDIQVVQWPSQGGQVQNFKVMAMIVPQFRADINGTTGEIHGTTA